MIVPIGIGETYNCKSITFVWLNEGISERSSVWANVPESQMTAKNVASGAIYLASFVRMLKRYMH